MALDLHKPVSTRLGQLLTQSGFRSNKLMWHFKRGRDVYMSVRKPAKSIDSWQEPTLAEAIDWLSRTLHIIVQVRPVVELKYKLRYQVVAYDLSTCIDDEPIVIKVKQNGAYYSPRTAIQAAITDILKENK
jgi:hypothetical protein